MLEVPVSLLTNDYRDLLESLTVDNPDYKNASFFGRGKVSKKIPSKLFFFRTKEETKTVLIPRNSPEKYFLSADHVGLYISNGKDISKTTIQGFQLRDYQDSYLNNEVIPYISNLPHNVDVLLNAPCGRGKTMMALYMAKHYGKNTIVSVTTKKIGKQFIETCQRFFPDWTVGWAEDYKDYDIVVGTYALLSDEKFGERYFSNFGHIILDEFHRCGADTYGRILEKAPCKYRTSLTATFRRKDGLHKILQYHAGKVITMHIKDTSATVIPFKTGVSIDEDRLKSVDRFPARTEKLGTYAGVCVRSIVTKKEIDRGTIDSISSVKIKILSINTKRLEEYNLTEVRLFKLGTISSPMLDTEISEDSWRTEMFCELIKLLHSKKRKVIVLSKRKEQLYKMGYTLKRYGIPCGVIVSEKEKDYKSYCEKNGKTVKDMVSWIYEEASVLLGIDKLAEEGMDAPRYDTLIYLHPIRDVEQSIGRILREATEATGEKKSPLAIYPQDSVGSYNRAFNDKKAGAKKMFCDKGHKVLEPMGFEQLKEYIKNS